MIEEQIVKQEVVKSDNDEKTVYHFNSSEYDYETITKEVYKKEDKFVVFPYYYHKKSGEIRSTFGDIKSITFKGFNHKFPSAGFRKGVSDGGGYGITSQLKPLFKAIQECLDIEELIISKKDKTKLIQKKLFLNYKDLEAIRKPLNSILGTAREENKVLANNFLSSHFPSKVEKLAVKNTPQNLNYALPLSAADIFNMISMNLTV